MNRLRSISGDCSRLGYVPTFRNLDCLASRSLAEGIKCHGIFGSGDKIQTTANTQIGASEDAVQAAGASSVAAKDDTRVIGAGAVGAQDGGVALLNSNLNAGGVTGSNVGGNITINGAAGAEAIAQKFADTVAQINDTASADKLQAQSLVSEALGKVTQLSESKQTEGITSLGRLVLWGLGLSLAALLVWKWNK